MNAKRSLAALAVLISIALYSVGRAADYSAHPRTCAYMQSQVPDEGDALKPQPLVTPSHDNDSYPNDAGLRTNCCPPPPDCGCDSCCPDACGCGCIRKQIFAEYMYLRPLNAGVEYAVPFNGPISAGTIPLQEGRTASVDPGFSSGFRVGGALWYDECSAVAATFSHYENNSYDAISTNSPLVLRAMVMHPSSLDADADWLDASAHQYIRFELVDLDYRHEFYCSEHTSANYLVGIRYANLRQQFDSEFSSIITGNVDTDVNFDGGGFRLGIEAERRGMGCFSGYAKASASFLGGEFRGTYLQTDTNLPVVTQTDWKEARFVSILECEVGLRWTSCNNRWRASAGYTINEWANIVKTGEFISSVQANKYHGPDKISGNGLVFDGFVARVEYNW
jgi:hypothetical protein